MVLEFLSKPSFYDTLWHSYQDHTHEKILEEVADHIETINLEKEETLKVLDISCGTGTLLKKLEQIEQVDLHGIDISPEMLEVAKQKTNATLTQGNAQDLQYNNNTFHIIISSSAYHLYKEKQRFVTEAERCLKTNGLLILLDWDASGPHKYLYKAMNIFTKEDLYLGSGKRAKKRFKEVRTDDINLRTWYWWTWKFFLLTAQKHTFDTS